MARHIYMSITRSVFSSLAHPAAESRADYYSQEEANSVVGTTNDKSEESWQNIAPLPAASL